MRLSGAKRSYATDFSQTGGDRPGVGPQVWSHSFNHLAHYAAKKGGKEEGCSLSKKRALQSTATCLQPRPPQPWCPQSLPTQACPAEMATDRTWLWMTECNLPHLQKLSFMADSGNIHRCRNYPRLPRESSQYSLNTFWHTCASGSATASERQRHHF